MSINWHYHTHSLWNSQLPHVALLKSPYIHSELGICIHKTRTRTGVTLSLVFFLFLYTLKTSFPLPDFFFAWCVVAEVWKSPYHKKAKNRIKMIMLFNRKLFEIYNRKQFEIIYQHWDKEKYLNTLPGRAVCDVLAGCFFNALLNCAIPKTTFLIFIHRK